MKAAVIYEHGGPGSIRYETQFPDPRPAPNEVLLQVKAATMNYHDIFTRGGMPGIRLKMPCIMGIDFAGEIVEVGAQVTDWKVGQAVLVDPFDRIAGGLMGETRPGGFAEYCCVRDYMLIPLPAGLSFDEAAALPAAYGTAHRMLHTIGGLKAGEKILILGASGGVGNCCVQLAKIAGCEVVAGASSPEKLDRLRELGADHVIDYRKEDFTKAIFERYSKPHRRSFEGGMDVVVNFTGGDTWVPSLKVLHRQGRVLTCGATAGFDPREDLRYIWGYELRVFGSNGWSREDVLAVLALAESRRLKPVIDRVVPLEQINEAFRVLEQREAFGKVVVKP